VFASEVKALLSLPQVPGRINEARIADYLVSELEGIDKTCTFYQEIFRLPPAQSATVSCENVSTQSYWALDPTREVHYSSDADYAEAFREIFTEAVRCRLRSAGRPASMLSGGLDSSSIVGVARQLLSGNGSGPLLTFSAVSEGEADCPETRFIHMVLGLGALEAHTVRPDQLGAILGDLEYVLYQADDLFGNVMTIPQVMYIAARRQGVKVLLDGIDGDLVASQDENYIAYLLRSGRWLGLSRHYYRHYHSAWKLLYRNSLSSLHPLIPSPVRRLRRRLLHRKNDLNGAPEGSIINPDFATRIGLAERLKSLRAGRATSSPKTAREEHAYGLSSPYITVGLERYERVAAAYSIEPRHPFMDKRLAEYCLALPREQKIHQGWSKIALRRAMGGILPEAVRWREGWEHLGWSFIGALLALEGGFLERASSNALEDIGEYVDMDAVREAYERYVSQGSIPDGAKVWEAVTLAAWLGRQRRGSPRSSVLEKRVEFATQPADV
jgi:asparagine synthase (glutamine-hydrolysing)